MAGALGVNASRGELEIWWDNSAADADVEVRVVAENIETGDVGVKLSTNDGFATLSYPKGFRGIDSVKVLDPDDNVVAEGVIFVNVPED